LALITQINALLAAKQERLKGRVPALDLPPKAVAFGGRGCPERIHKQRGGRRVITRVWERLYLGSLRDAEQLATSNPLRITSVVSLCSHKVPHKASGVRYTRVPIPDSRPISARQFNAVMAAIAEGIRNDKLLIHCVGGVSRSPIMTAAWLHRCGCLNIVTALREIAERRPAIDPSPALLRSVAAHLRR
jgi:protein-tyrosine phosphatase